jgi:hypothetical protein
MAVFKVSGTELVPLELTTFEREGIRERSDLQRLVRARINMLAPETLVIAEEFGDWDAGRRRIDLLALDKQANLVVIELKRDETGAHMELQAIRYAAMVSTMTFERAVAARGNFLKLTGGDPQDAARDILEFLEWDEAQPDEFARDVRVILVAAEFSKELTTTVLWLNERDLDIRCVRMRPCKSGGELFLDVQQVIPLPEAQEYQVRVREQAAERRVSSQDNRDFTKYVFEGQIYNKRRLVLAIVQAYVRDHPGTTLAQLEKVFPANLQGSHRVFKTIEDALDVVNRTGHKRHFIDPDEVIKLADDRKVAVATMWGADNLKAFLDQARTLGYTPKEEVPA